MLSFAPIWRAALNSEQVLIRIITFNPSNGVLDVQTSTELRGTVEHNKFTSVIACLRCQLKVSATTDDSGLVLSYDADHWIKRCCCNDLSSPAECCSFLTLEALVNTLPRAPKVLT